MANVVWLLMAPTTYITLATLGLLQFSFALSALGSLFVAAQKQAPVVAPVLGSYLRHVEAIFGPTYKPFTPSPTQVVLVALMLAVIVERGR